MKKSIQLIKNKYFISTLALLIVLIVFEDTNIYRQYKMQRQLKDIMAANEQKREEIEEIKVKLNELTTNPEELEKFARETYRMKKEDEVIFLFVDEAKKPKE